MQIHLNNSLTKKIEPFEPIDKKLVSMYSCGPTVYNYAHIGNMRAFLFADLLQRILKVVGGYDVRWIMNITNIDDKTIRDSAAGSKEWLPQMGEQTIDPKENLKNFTEYFENEFVKDISLLGLKREHFFAMPKATEYIKEMQELIKSIVDKGFGYVSEGSVYFNVAKWRQSDVYGKLFYIDFEKFRSGVRIDADQYEREDVSDFVLWKAQKLNEPYWDFEIDGNSCPGRPGWHIECSAMEYVLLGLPFDIHTGGVDLKFPHHEDEIAQSKAGYGIEPTRYWCHNEFLEVEGEKMSKSKGNFFTLRDLINKGLDPLNIRFAMLSSHYASTYNFTFDGVKAAAKARERVQDYIYSLFENSTGSTRIGADEIRNLIFSELADDLHTPKALARLFTFINNNPAENLDEHSKKDLLLLFEQLDLIFDVWDLNQRREEKLIVPDEVIQWAEERLAAKKKQNFSLSDELRNKIKSAGFVIKDTKEGYEIKKG